MDAEVVQAVVHPVAAVEQEKRDHRDDGELAEAVLRQGKDALVAHRLPAEKVERHGDAGDEDEHRPDERRKHAARAEQRPEDRLVRAFHGRLHRPNHHTATKSAAEHSTDAVIPLATMTPAGVRLYGSVFGITLNQVQAW